MEIKKEDIERMAKEFRAEKREEGSVFSKELDKLQGVDKDGDKPSEENLFYEYKRGDFLVTFNYQGGKHEVKFYKHNELLCSPMTFSYRFWTKPRNKLDLFNTFVRCKIWDGKKEAHLIESLGIELYNSLKEFEIKKNEETPISKELTTEEKQRVLDLLRDKDVLKRIRKDMDKVIAGEYPTKLLLLLIYITSQLSKKVHPRMTGGTSSGKSFLLNIVANYLPEEWIEWRATRATGKSLEYHLANKNLNGKILIIQEFEGAQDTVISLRPLMSEDQEGGGLSLKTVEKDEFGNIVAKEVNCEGTPIVATASTQVKLDNEFETRTWKLETDESIEQSKLIIKYESEKEIYEDIHKSEILNDIKNCLRFLSGLKMDKVKILFSHVIGDNIPSSSLRIRRDYKKILSFVWASAWIHQLQRPIMIINDKKYIIATLEDFFIAQELYQPSAENVFGGRSKKMEKIYEKVKQICEDKKKRGQPSKAEVVDVVHRMTGETTRTIMPYIRELCDLGILYSETHLSDKRKKVFYPSSIEDRSTDVLGISKEIFIRDFKQENLRGIIKELSLETPFKVGTLNDTSVDVSQVYLNDISVLKSNLKDLEIDDLFKKIFE